MQIKYCPICKKEKPLSEFYKHKNRKDGHSGQCAECIKTFSKKWYRETIDERKKYYESTKERKKQYKSTIRNKNSLSGIKQRAKKKGLEFNLTIEDIPLTAYCPVFGWLLERTNKANDKSPSVDRIDSTKGYTKDNIQILSNKANRMKQDATPEELLMFADWIYKTYKK